jgi:AcrR family transcriptional regulator
MEIAGISIIGETAASASTEPALRPRSPGRPRRQESEDAILNAVMLILASDGYVGLTTDKIAARARVSKSTIYRRWATKEHMVLAAFTRTSPLEPVDTGDLEQDLLNIVEQFVRLLRETPLGGALPALMVERLHNPALAAAFDPIVTRRREPAKIVLERAIQRGTLEPVLDMELALDLIFGPVTLRALFMSGDVTRDALLALIRAALRGLGHRATREPTAKIKAG